MTNPNAQMITFETLAGPREIAAPKGYTFGKTETIVWVKLMAVTRSWLAASAKEKSTKRQVAVLEGQSDALGNVLANALGMSTFFWEMEARAFARQEAGSVA